MDGQASRIKWIDIFKGIGITLVVIGHMWSPGGKFILWFHMPLFFFISGYLYNSDISIEKYLKKKFLRLIVPYLSFLFLLSIPDYIVCFNSANSTMNSHLFGDIISLTIKQIYGGRDLYGWFDVFWFVTCLFLTQQIFHIINRLCNKKSLFVFIIILFLFIHATICQYLPYLRLPLFWGINIVPMAILFFYIGHIIPEKILNKKTILIVSIIFLLLAIILDIKGIMNHEFKMKWEAYGMPIINIVLAFCGIVTISNISKLFSHNKIISTIFTELGKASLIIMFLHQAIRQIAFSRLSFINNEWIIIVVTLTGCYCVYFALSLFKITQRVFLGEIRYKGN